MRDLSQLNRTGSAVVMQVAARLTYSYLLAYLLLLTYLLAPSSCRSSYAAPHALSPTMFGYIIRIALCPRTPIYHAQHDGGDGGRVCLGSGGGPEVHYKVREEDVDSMCAGVVVVVAAAAAAAVVLAADDDDVDAVVATAAAAVAVVAAAAVVVVVAAVAAAAVVVVEAASTAAHVCCLKGAPRSSTPRAYSLRRAPHSSLRCTQATITTVMAAAHIITPPPYCC